MMTVPGGMTEVTGYSVMVSVVPTVIVVVVTKIVVRATVSVVRSQVVPSYTVVLSFHADCGNAERYVTAGSFVTSGGHQVVVGVH